MYNPLSGCSAIVHLFIKHPILIVGLGLTGALNYFSAPDAVESVPKGDKQEIVYQESAQGMLVPVNAVQEKMLIKATEETAAILVTEDSDSVSLEKEINAILPEYREKVAEKIKETSEIWFDAIKTTESGNQPIGVHPDGVSFGPAGLTRIALEEVLRKIPNCEDLGYDEVLDDPEMSANFAYLYFLDLIHQFKNIEIAVIAYNNGPTRVRRWQKEGRELPEMYLRKVKANLK